MRTVAERSTDSKLVHPMKLLLPMDSSVAGNKTARRAAQPENALSPISVWPSGMVMRPLLSTSVHVVPVLDSDWASAGPRAHARGGGVSLRAHR